MRHPTESELALYAGRDLGRLAAWCVKRHVSGCSQCAARVDEFEALRAELPKLGALPEDTDWNRLAAEMKANIHLGLEAGECVGGGELTPAFSAARTLLAYAGVIVLVVAGLWLQRTAPPLASGGGVVLETAGNSVELKQDGATLGLRYDRGTDVTYSASARGAVGARYVDADTGNVTVVNVKLQ